MDIDEILLKPGKEWTPEESRHVRVHIKNKGRAALKSDRIEKLKKETKSQSNNRSELLEIKQKKDKLDGRRNQRV